MITAIREQFTAKNLIEKVIIPLAAFLVLGWFQTHVYDWEQIGNSSYKHAVEIAAYIIILLVIYVVLSPLLWLRPPLKIKVYKAGSSRVRPQTSEVLYQQDRTRQADITMDIEFNPSWWTRKLYELAGDNVGIRFACKPPNLLTCGPNLAGDVAYSAFDGQQLLLRPFGKMNLEEPDPFAQYEFRFGLGTNQLLSRVPLRPRHLNFRSRLLFSLHFDNAFLFDIQQHQ